MLTLTVFGRTPPCAKCEAPCVEETFPGQVEVRKLDALGPSKTPVASSSRTVMLGDRVVASDGISRADELKALSKKSSWANP